MHAVLSVSSLKLSVLSVGSRRSSGSWDGNSKCPTSIRAETVSRHIEVMTLSSSSTGHTTDRSPSSIPGSLVKPCDEGKPVMHHRHELELHSFRHIEPMKVDMHKLPLLLNSVVFRVHSASEVSDFVLYKFTTLLTASDRDRTLRELVRAVDFCQNQH